MTMAVKGLRRPGLRRQLRSVASPGGSINTLRYFESLCVNCGMCLDVCPHAVFEVGPEVVRLVQADACMECGACRRNCPTPAILVESGVGCAEALIRAALTGREPTCGPSDGSRGRVRVLRRAGERRLTVAAKGQTTRGP